MKTIHTAAAVLVSLSCILCSSVTAQITVTPNPVVVTNYTASDIDVVGHATITNTTQQPITVTWVRSIVQIDEYWSTAVCDITQCYLTWVSTASFVLNPGASGNMDVHVYPDGVLSTAHVELKITTNLNPNDTLIARYIFDHTLGSFAATHGPGVTIYPNPFSDSLQISGLQAKSEVVVYNSGGSLVKGAFVSSDHGRIDLSDLPSGLYYLRIKDVGKTHGENRTFRVVKIE